MASRAERRHVMLDTSCIVAVLCGWHARHEETVRALEMRLDAGLELALPAHALVETYSVLTRLPSPHRLSPENAIDLIEKNFRTGARTVALSAREVWSLLLTAPTAGVAGGRVYDAVIAASARKVDGPVLMTLNGRHFEQFDDGALEIASLG